MKEIMKKNLKIIVLLTSIVIVLIIIILTMIRTEDIEEPIIELEQKTEEVSKEELKTIKIDVKGEVKSPGVYELKENDRVSDAIEKSGGLTENADTELINLSKVLKDEMVIIVYNKNEIEELKTKSNQPETIIKYIEKKCTCPDTTNDACIDTSISQQQNNTKISINTASLEELMQVEGIGESKAKAIIKYREENGNFDTIEDIKKVSGIGESTFEKFKDNITL